MYMLWTMTSSGDVMVVRFAPFWAHVHSELLLSSRAATHVMIAGGPMPHPFAWRLLYCTHLSRYATCIA